MRFLRCRQFVVTLVKIMDREITVLPPSVFSFFSFNGATYNIRSPMAFLIFAGGVYYLLFLCEEQWEE